MRPIDADFAIEIIKKSAFLTNTEKISLVLILSSISTLAMPPNDPLTLEELRGMDGEPVWIERHDGAPSRYAVVGDFKSLYGVYFGTAQGGLRLPYDGYGKTWLAYRRRLEEGTV